MNTKTTKEKPKPDSGSHALSQLPIEADERHQDLVDDFIARNREELNKGLRIARAEAAAGHKSTRSIDEVIAQGRRRHGQSA